MKNKLLAIAVFVAAFMLVVALIVSKKKNGEEEYDVVFFGDSVIACEYAPWSVPEIMNTTDDTYSVLNAAFGGLTMSTIRDIKANGDTSDLFSMLALSKALKENDFSLQVLGAQQNNPGATEGWYEVSRSLSRTDWHKVKYILIEQCANDYLQGKPVDNPDNPYDENTFGGALRTVIKNVREGVPNAKIVIATPIYMNPLGLKGDCYTADYGGGILPDYVNKELEIATHFDCLVIDNFSELNINADNYEQYIPGGLHGNEIGNALIAENILRHLKEFDEQY